MRTVCLVLVAFLLPIAVAPAELVELRKVADLPKVWTAGQQVYTKGDTGISPTSLEELSRWLKENAPHWTVVIADTAKGEQFVSTDGLKLYDLPAVEFAMGNGMANQSAFGSLKDPRTGQRNGVVFTVLTKDRKVLYSPSEEQAAFGVGRNQWKGYLDQKAIEALRSGMNVRSAVERTVEAVEGGITRALQNKENARLERVASVRRKLWETRGELTRLEEMTGKLRAKHPEMTGEIANPPVAAYQALLTGLEERANENPGDAERQADSVMKKIRNDIQLLQDYSSSARRLHEAEARIQNLQASRFAPAAGAEIAEARTAYAEAADAYAQGDLDYGKKIEIVTRELAEANRTVSRAEQLRTTQEILGTGGLVIVILTLVILNLRRRGEKAKALRLLQEWRALLSSKTDSLLALLSEARMSVGSILDAEERFAGVTLEKAKETIRAIDELFILSSHLTEIVDRADRIAHPRGPGILLNTFSAAPYRKVTGILTTSKVEFDPKTPVKKLVTNKGDAGGLLGRIEDYHPFEIRLNQLVDVFNDRAEQVTKNLQEISSAWPEADTLSTRLREVVPALESYPALPALKTSLIPALDKSGAEAAYLGIKDAIAALPRLRELSRAAAQAESLGRLTRLEPSETERLDKAGAALSAAGIANDWLAQTQENLRQRANTTVSRCIPEDISAELADLGTLRSDWLARAEQSVELSELILKLEQDLAAHRANLGSDRQKLAFALAEAGFDVREEDLFREAASALPVKYNTAAEQLSTARGDLANGNTAACSTALQAAKMLLRESDEAIAGSLKLTGEFQARHAELTNRRAQLQGEADEACKCLANLSAVFDASALIIRDGSTIADNHREIGGYDEQAGRALVAAREAMQKGHPLRARSELETAARNLDSAKYYIGEIYLRKEELEAIQKENRNVAAVLGEDQGKIVARRDEFATREINRKAASGLIPQIEAVEGWLAEVPQDPVEVSSWLAALSAEVSKVKTDFKNDADLLEIARSEIGAALNQLNSAQTLGSSKLDSPLAPSEKLRKAQGDVRQAGAELETLQHQMRVPHSDWDAIAKSASELTSELSQSIAEIRGELAAAARALTTLRRAQATVRHAGGWTGRRGVRVQGTPGKAQLSVSEEMLATGRYALAEANAEQSIRIAQLAIAAAEALVRKLDREAEEAEAARRSSWHDSSSSSSDSWSSSSSSSDSGSSSSSFSSDSGTSTSDF